MDGFPSKDFFPSIDNSDPLYFLLKEETMNQYLNNVSAVSVNNLGLKINEFSVYKLAKK